MRPLSAGSRKCRHGVVVGPLDDYGVPDDVDVSPHSSYCWVCAGLDGPTSDYPDPKAGCFPKETPT